MIDGVSDRRKDPADRAGWGGGRRGGRVRGGGLARGPTPHWGAADDRWVWRPEEGPGLQERLGGRPFRPDGDVPREPEPLAMGESPREAGLLPGPPRRAAGARGAGAQGPRLIAASLGDASADRGRAGGPRLGGPARRAGAPVPLFMAASRGDTPAAAGPASGRRFRAPGRRPFSIHPTS